MIDSIAQMVTLISLLSALWLTPTSAVITWNGAGCLYRIPAGEQARLIVCDVRDVGHVIYLGAGLTDAAYRPAAGDVYTLWRDGRAVARAELRSVVYLPAMY